MEFKSIKSVYGWTKAWQSKSFREYVPGTPYSTFGVALLFYKAEKRLSVSIWFPNF